MVSFNGIITCTEKVRAGLSTQSGISVLGWFCFITVVAAEGCSRSPYISLSDTREISNQEEGYLVQARAARRSLHLTRMYRDRQPRAHLAMVRVTVAKIPPPGSMKIDDCQTTYANVLPLPNGGADIFLAVTAEKSYRWPVHILVKAGGKAIANATETDETDGGPPIYGQPNKGVEAEDRVPAERKLTWKFVKPWFPVATHYRYRQDLYRNGTWKGTLLGY